MGDKGSLFISCRESDDDLILTFRDSGPGISETDLPQIFDPFFTTKDVGEGTGLGLAVTYSLVQRMQGEISDESRAEEGTRFETAIPFEDRNR